MSISIMAKNGPLLVPNQSGGVNLDVLTRLSSLEREVEAIKNLKATENGYGLAMISNAKDVTEVNSGLVMSAVQNNPSVSGTIASKIEELKAGNGIYKLLDLATLENGFSLIGSYEYSTVTISGNIVNVSAIVSGTFGGAERVILRLDNKIRPARNFVYTVRDSLDSMQEIRAVWDGTILSTAVGAEKQSIVSLNITYGTN